MSIDPKKFGLSDSLVSAVSEALKGGQVKLDKNHNGKLDGQDFKMLRKEENIDEISLKTKIKAYAATREPDADYNRGDKVHSQGDRLRSKIVAKHGEKAGDHADRAAYGKPSTPATRSAEKSKSDPLTKATSSTNKMRITKSGVANKQDQKSNAAVIKSRIGKHGKSNLPEDIEQVDELSKATLGSYIKKAATDVATNSAATGRHAERSNKIADHQKKTGDYSHENQRRKDSKTADKAFDKSWKRRQGINKATDKLTKEDVQVDEVLDTNVKKFAYLMKAKKSIKKSDPNDIKQANDIANRTIGVKRLMKKLTKEEVVDEGKGPNGNPLVYADATTKARNPLVYGDKKKTNPLVYRDKHRDNPMVFGKKKVTKEEAEQVDELSTDTYHSAAKKAAKRAMGDAQGRSGPIFKKYAGMANKFRDKGMSQEKKEKAVKEEAIDEAGMSRREAGAHWDANKSAEKKSDTMADYKNKTAYQKAAKSAKMKAYRADRDKNMEEEIQIDEISKKLTARYNNKVGPIINKNQNSGGDPAKLLKRKNREAGHKLSWNKYHNYKVKIPATEETDPGFAEATENPIAKELAAKKTEIQKSIAQKKMQVMQAKAQKTISAMKESKKGCTCTEGKKSMSCEVCNDKVMGIKGGKEKIQLNPPLRD